MPDPRSLQPACKPIALSELIDPVDDGHDLTLTSLTSFDAAASDHAALEIDGDVRRDYVVTFLRPYFSHFRRRHEARRD
jgi:hypothetical protein